nr:GTP-binding protein [Bartonella australis]
MAVFYTVRGGFIRILESLMIQRPHRFYAIVVETTELADLIPAV